MNQHTLTLGTTHNVLQRYEQYVAPTYVRQPLVLTKGKGSRVWDVDGHEYLDLFPGWGVGLLGHCHRAVVQALRSQSGKIMHVPNNFLHPLQATLAQAIVQHAFDGKVFLANSGAEAIEGAIKCARKWGQGRFEIITMERSFHGRTLAALAATGQSKYQEGFAPLPEGFRTVPFNDLEAVKHAMTTNTVAVLVEPIQGEGGIRVASRDYLQGLRRLCTERQLLLIMDEVQTGMGRTGRWFAYQHAEIEPDLLVLAKGLGGGFPIGALVIHRRLGDVLGPGTHAATFGGNPLACACALAVFDAIEREALLERATTLGRFLVEELRILQSRHAVISDVRGVGLMVGVELAVPGQPIVDACRQRRVLINCTQARVLRLLPALTVTKTQLIQGLRILTASLVEGCHA